MGYHGGFCVHGEMHCSRYHRFCGLLYGYDDERLKAQRRAEEEEPREPFCENWGRRLAEWSHANKRSSQ